MTEDRGFPYFFLGVGIGIAIGILFAPKSGEETRSLIKEKAGQGKDYLNRQRESLQESASDYVEKGKSALQRQRDNLSAAVEAGKQAYREAVSEDESGSESAPSA